MKDKNVWKPIKGYEKEYEISKTAVIRNIKTGKILKPYVNENGYLVIRLTKNHKSKIERVHRLLMLTYVKQPKGKNIVNHKNGNKLDLDLGNLEWCTSSENNIHAIKTGLRSYDKIKNEYRITIDNLEYVSLGAKGAAIYLHDNGYFKDISIESLSSAIVRCALHHALYQGVLKCELTSDPYETPKKYHKCGIKGCPIRLRLNSGFTVKAKGPAKLFDKMVKMGYWKHLSDNRTKCIKHISESANTGGYCYGYKVWYVK